MQMKSEKFAEEEFDAVNYVYGLVDCDYAVFLSGLAGDGREGFPAMSVEGGWGGWGTDCKGGGDEDEGEESHIQLWLNRCGQVSEQQFILNYETKQHCQALLRNSHKVLRFGRLRLHMWRERYIYMYHNLFSSFQSNSNTLTWPDPWWTKTSRPAANCVNEDLYSGGTRRSFSPSRVIQSSLISMIFFGWESREEALVSLRLVRIMILSAVRNDWLWRKVNSLYPLIVRTFTVCWRANEVASQIFSISDSYEASSLPSGENANSSTQEKCPFEVRCRVPE